MSIDVDNLTLAELEAIAQRLDAAAKVFRDARLLLGGAATASTSVTPSNAVVVSPSPGTRVRTPLAPGEAEDLAAQRAALVARNRPEDMPDEIQRAERTPPP